MQVADMLMLFVDEEDSQPFLDFITAVVTRITREVSQHDASADKYAEAAAKSAELQRQAQKRKQRPHLKVIVNNDKDEKDEKN